MTRGLYVIAIRWIRTPLNPPFVDGLLTPLGDWVRFNGFTWLLWTDRKAHGIYEQLKPNFQTEDTILVLKCDPRDFQGWAAPWIGKWLEDKKISVSTRA